MPSRWCGMMGYADALLSLIAGSAMLYIDIDALECVTVGVAY